MACHHLSPPPTPSSNLRLLRGQRHSFTSVRLRNAFLEGRKKGRRLERSWVMRFSLKLGLAFVHFLPSQVNDPGSFLLLLPFLDIHGVPGTGKTATVHSVVRDLQQDEVRFSFRFQPSGISSCSSSQDMDHFQFVEINGMKISEPNTAFSVLWESLSGNKLAPKQALTQLENHFQTPDPTRKTTWVLCYSSCMTNS